MAKGAGPGLPGRHKFEVFQYQKTDIWNEILSFRPHLLPGHDPLCGGITDTLKLSEAACSKCRQWLDLLLRHGTLA